MKSIKKNLVLLLPSLLLLVFVMLLLMPKNTNTALADETCLRFSHYQSGNYIESTTGGLYCCQYDEVYEDYYSVGQETTCISGGTGCAVYSCDVDNPDLICETTPDPNCDYQVIPPDGE